MTKALSRQVVQPPRAVGKALRTGACSLAAIVALAGCGDARMRWKEQVKLDSGEVVVVARSARFSENWIPGGGGGSLVKGMSVQLEQPKGYGALAPWHESYVPIVMDRDPESGEWFIVATFYHCDAWYEWGRPRLPYAEFRLRGGAWVRQPLSDKWIGRRTNLMLADPAYESVITESRPVLRIERKERFLEMAVMSRRFEYIVNDWSTNC